MIDFIRSFAIGGMRKGVIFSCMCLVFLSQPASAHADDKARWKAMLLACVSFAEAGETAMSDDWTRGLTGRANAQYVNFELSVAIDVTPIPDGRPNRETICANARSARLTGNDQRGLALRAVAHAALDDGLSFHDADQIGPADVWRGCAYDGQEYRLSSMTQTTTAEFWITISPRAPACTYLGS